MGVLHTFPNARVARLASILQRRHSASQIADAIELLIDVLDLIGNDADAEESDAEDSFALSWIARGNAPGPGCPISDAAEEGDEDRCQAGDDGCSAFMLNGLHYGSDAECIYTTLPIYGADQSTGPVNENEAHRLHMEALWEPAR